MKHILGTILLAFLALTLQACGGGGDPVIPATVNVPASKSPPQTASDVLTTITFVNKSQVEVKVYWVDFTGAEKFYKTLASGATFTQETWPNNPWVARVSSTNAAVLYVVSGRTPVTAEIPAK